LIGKKEYGGQKAKKAHKRRGAEEMEEELDGNFHTRTKMNLAEKQLESENQER